MEVLTAAALPVTGQDSAVQTRPTPRLECRPHWGALMGPIFALAAWLVTGLEMAWLVEDLRNLSGITHSIIGPRLILAAYLGTTAVLVWLYWRSYRKSAIRLVDQKAVVRSGLFPLFNSSAEIDLRRATEVSLRESWLGRLFNYGTVLILGPTGAPFRIRFVPNPQHFYQTLRSVVDGASAV
jgi:hypothetical protein